MEENKQQIFLNNILANTLHEIRTPIQTIIGALELLSDTKVNNEQTEYIRQIQFSADVLLSLANNVLDYSKMQTKQFKLESIKFDVHSLVEQVTDLICIEAFNKGLEVVTDIDPEVPKFVIGDPTRVQQILLNLLKNAVKFTPKGYIRCRLSLAKKAENFDASDLDGSLTETKIGAKAESALTRTLLFEVIDTGIGISEENSKKLFTSFYQGDASISRKYGGTGLGLSICKGLTRLMKGEIGVEKNPSGGSKFWFEIPLKEPSKQEELNRQIECKPEVKILVVDSSEIACKSLGNKIKQCGIENVLTSFSSEDALNLLEAAESQNSPFSVIFINMFLSGIDGWHLASEIREKKLCEKSKLFLTVPEGQMGGEAKMKLLNWFSGYLYKPVKHEKLFNTLNEAICEKSIIENEKPLEKQAEVQEKNIPRIMNGLSVLVAEDHPVNRKLIVAFLKKLGVKVSEAVDGNEAVQVIKNRADVDIIFMDIQMPVKNGIQATDEIRSLGYRGIIIACTANNDFSTVDEYEKHGFNDTLIKPFKSSTVREVLLKWQDFCIMPAELIPEEK